LHRSAELECAQGEECAEDPDDPKANDDLRLLPPPFLEVMVEWRSPENAVRLGVFQVVSPASVLEDIALHDNREHLGHKHRADEREHELRFEKDCHRTEPAAERERAGITHENLGRMRVEPQETDQRADHGETKNGEL